MATNAIVRARIDGRVKEEASAILASMGLTASDAFRMLMTKVAREKRLPFDPLIPNEETIQAMLAARRGEVTSVKNIDDLLGSLNADD